MIRDLVIAFLLLLVLIMSFGCKKDDEFEFDHSKWNAIRAGDYDNAVVLTVKDTIDSPSAYIVESLMLDINKDSKQDMQFYSYYDCFLYQSKFAFIAIVYTFPGCDIIVDSATYPVRKRVDCIYTDGRPIDGETIYIDSLMIIPKALEENQLINSESAFYPNGRRFSFSFHYDNVVSLGPPAYIFENYTFEGWNKLNEKYLGYRIMLENDTLFGFVKLTVSGFKTILVEDIVYR